MSRLDIPARPPARNDLNYQNLAAAVVEQALLDLKVPPPSNSERPLEPGKLKRWHSAWRNWETRRRDALRWLDSRGALIWCDFAGLELEVLKDYLKRKELLYDPEERVPPGRTEALVESGAEGSVGAAL